MRHWRWIVVLLLAAFALGCEDKGYSQATPGDVLVTARRMVENGDARRLTDLVHADTPEMRQFLRDMGRTLDNLADLGLAVQARFPDEVAALRTEAEQSIKAGQGSSFVGRVIGIAGQGRRARRDPAAAQEMRALFDRMAMEVMADPYAWLTRNQERLRASTDGMPDGAAVLQWDADPASDRDSDWAPILAGAFTLREADGLWYVAFPPAARAVMPKSAEEWEIASFILEVVDNALIDMRKDVSSGKAKRLEEVAGMAGEKAFLPMAFAIMAYGRATEARREAARAASPQPAPPASPAQKR